MVIERLDIPKTCVCINATGLLADAFKIIDIKATGVRGCLSDFLSPIGPHSALMIVLACWIGGLKSRRSKTYAKEIKSIFLVKSSVSATSTGRYLAPSGLSADSERFIDIENIF